MSSSTASSPPFLQLSNVGKTYGGVRALEGVDLTCRRGSIHAIMGENGAGKSTLIKTVAGVVRPTTGEIRLEGVPVHFHGPAEANAQGIVCVFQELSLMPDLTVADNICAAAPPRRGGLIDMKAQRRIAEELLASIGCEDVHPLASVHDLSLSRRQMVEIAKALGKKPKLLILDEATSALTRRDVETVYALLERLRDEGLCLLYISHRQAEIEKLADTISVFRNGRHIETFSKGTRTNDEIVRMMIGREITAHFPPKPPPPPVSSEPPLLSLENLSWDRQLKGISLDVRKGEIVGLGGLDGQGQKELLLALFGVLKGVSGTVRINGKPAPLHGPVDAKERHALALIPEDRKTEGLMLNMSIAENLIAASFDKIAPAGVVDRGREKQAVDEAIRRLQIKVSDPHNAVSTLSGGNQQKVVIAKWLMTGPQVLLLNDPTRGIDVGTKQEIYRLLRDLAAEGTGILFYSTDYEELIGCCDRVAVLYDGHVVAELSGAGLNEHALIESALNLEPAGAVAPAHEEALS